MSEENVLIVQTDSPETSRGWATLGGRRWRCTVGEGGIREDKVEGDAATPAGEYPLRRLYFRNDRLVLPKVRLPARPISEHDGWCDDPRSPTYNRLVHVPNDWSSERMWREDGLYDIEGHLLDRHRAGQPQAPAHDVDLVGVDVHLDQDGERLVGHRSR